MQKRNFKQHKKVLRVYLNVSAANVLCHLDDINFSVSFHSKKEFPEAQECLSVFLTANINKNVFL